MLNQANAVQQIAGQLGAPNAGFIDGLAHQVDIQTVAIADLRSEFDLRIEQGLRRVAEAGSAIAGGRGAAEQLIGGIMLRLEVLEITQVDHSQALVNNRQMGEQLTAACQKADAERRAGAADTCSRLASVKEAQRDAAYKQRHLFGGVQ